MSNGIATGTTHTTGFILVVPDRQSHLWIDYVRALYSLMEEETAKVFPDTELMLCSGGGGRADYGALRYFHEFWPSDNTDPVTRLKMQWNYSYFFPAMALCSHVTHWGPAAFALCLLCGHERALRNGPRPGENCRRRTKLFVQEPLGRTSKSGR